MTELYETTRRTWEDIWDDANVEIELEALEYTRSKEVLDTYVPYLPDGEIIVEAGCGLSAAVIHLRRLGLNVHGLDYAVNALQAGRKYDPTLPLHAGDVHALPYADASVAGYLSFGVLEHFEHGMGPALAEAARVLRPGGVLVLTIPYPSVVWRLIQWRRKQQGLSRLTNDDFYESTYTHLQLKHEAEEAGFEVVALKPTSHAFTLWGLGSIFRGSGYYETSVLADRVGRLLRILAPWSFNFTTLLIGRKK